MVDPDPGYRPRRAFDAPTPASDRSDAEPRTEPPTTEPPTTGPAQAEEQAPPLYREEPSAAAAADHPAGGSSAETKAVRPPTFKPRARRTPEDDDSTTLLARTPGGRRPASAADDLDIDDGHPHRLLGRRGRLALLVGGLAAVIAVGLAVMYAVSTVGNTPSADPPPGAPRQTARPTAPATNPSAVLGDATLLTAAAAKQIAGGSWKISLTQRPPAADAPTAACVSEEPAEGQPVARQQVLQLLSGSGRSAPSALHQAAAYASPQDAAQAYAVAAKTLGSCTSPGAYIFEGSNITNLGDQSTGLIANVVTAGKTQWHSIVLSRNGSVVNLVDAARPGKPLGVQGVAAALAAVTQAQCQAAGQSCTAKPSVTFGPPPIGGDVPGFLTAGDLPPVGKADEAWVATPAELPSEEFLGSQCETVTWARLDAESASSRVYLVPSSTKFGLNDIVLTMKSEKAADALVAKIRSDLRSCEKRKLTATVLEPKKVQGVGAKAAPVTGWTSTVAQKSTQGTQLYRVGIVSSGTKVAYTFLNPLAGGYDLSRAEWDKVAVRAGQRMTQVP
nr:hypothetical protein [uncultured Friedmanniella sp.]